MTTFSKPRPPAAENAGGDDAAQAPPVVIDSAGSTMAAGGEGWRSTVLVGLVFGAGLALCLLVYLSLAVPSSWFPGATTSAWTAPTLTLARGAGGISGDDLLLTAVDPAGMAVVSVSTDLRASDFAAIAWIAADLPDDAEATLVWRTDVQPRKINATRIPVSSGHTLPVILAGDPAWTSRVTGLALVIRATLSNPVRIRGVVAKPMGAAEIVRDRAREWFAFEGWTGTSINTVVGGAEFQELPLPPLVAGACAVAFALLLALRRWMPGIAPGPTAGWLLGIVALAWLALDARWSWDLWQQGRITLREYAGKSSAEKHLVAEDAALYAFVSKARAMMPKTPVRVFIVSDEPYFRARAAYHLYPYNVFSDRNLAVLPPAGVLRPGDWLLEYQGRGVVYDPANGILRWSPDQTIAVEPKLLAPGAALFVVR